MSDSDSDVPELVPSSDEEDTKVIKTNVECVDIWLSKNMKFLEKQEQHIHIFSLGPFIMGLESFISKPWFFCLYDAKLLNAKIHREKTEYTKLSEEEWQNLDIVDVVTKLFIKKMRRKKFLINTLEMVDKIEEFNRGDGIDVKHSIQHAIRYPHIQEAVWEKALSMPHFSNKIQKVKFATLYVCKLCHMMITSLAREGKDIAEDFKKTIRTKCGGPEKALNCKDQGNQQYSQQKFPDAIKLYAEAIKADPFNHLCYGNRAQAYQKLEKYYEALADGRRAVLMKPDWIKGYYRYSQAFYHTGKIDMAIAINRKGMRICEKTKNNDKMLSELKDQGNKLQQEKDGVTTDEVLQQIINSDTYSCKESDIPEEIRDVPGCTRVIHLESALEQWSNKRHNQDASVLLSSDDQDSSEEEPTKISYEEAKKRVADSKKKQTKDPEVEKLTLTEGKGKSKQRGRHNNKTVDKQAKSGISQPPVVTAMDKSVKEKVVVEQNNGNREIETYLAEGSSAYLNGLGKKAVTSYQKALDLLSIHKPEKYGMDEQDVAVLEYAYGLSEISTGIYKHILDGIERFKNITETRKDCRLAFPYYGLGKAYITLNRFEEAIDPLNKCLRMASTFQLKELTWPGTSTKMQESITNELEKQVKELLTLTKYPPPPDAVCKLHTDKDDSRTVIFYSDPDFKGFVRIICFTNCIIEFHNQCWKDFKSRFGEKTCDKDILEKPCPTPDCMAGIYKIIIFRQDSMQKEITADRTIDKVEHPALKAKKPQVKLPPSSQEKIDKRKEKKELRKQRKKELKEEEDDILDDIETATPAPKETKPVVYEGTPVVNKPVRDTLVTPEAEIAVIKKTEETVVTKKSAKKKNKKKKDKAKQVLNVEVNFGDDNEKQLLGEDYVPEEETLKTTSSHQEEKVKSEDFKKAPVTKTEVPPPLQYDEIVQNLFLFFEDLLKAHGPLHINDAKITSMLEDFPPDAKEKIDIVGGLSKFLLQSTNFAMHGEIVCMREDAHKASKISKQQSESFASKASKLKSNSDSNQSQKSENPWKNKNKNSTNNSEVKESKSKGLAKAAVVEADIDYIDTVGSVKKKPKVSCMDTLDDFDYHDIPYDKPTINSKKSVEKSTEYPKIPLNKTEEKSKSVERSVSMDMDAIDDIDLIPVTRKSKKTKKKNRGMDDLDDFDWNISDSESFKDNPISDLDSISSKDDSSKIIGKEKIDLNNLNDYKVEKSEFKNDLSSSRSSSKSDISERSDLSTEMKTVKQKMPEFKMPNSKSMWPTKERTLNSSPNNFGPIGSPLPSEKFEKNEQSETLPSYSSYSNDKNGSLLLMDTQKAAEREKYRIDSQYVLELTEQVMKDMTFGKSLTENERQELRRQVSHDIWTDFKRKSKKSDQWTSKSNDTGYEYTTNKKSYTEQYMKNFYQKKNTDPTLNPESFAVVTSSNFFYGDGTFSNSVSTSNSGWPKSMSESLGYPGYQSSFTISQTTIGSMSPFQSASANVSSPFQSASANVSSPFQSASANVSSPFQSASANVSSPFQSTSSYVSSFPSATPTVSPFSSAFTPSLIPPVSSKQDYQSPFSLTTSKSDLFGNWSIGISVTQTSNNMTSASTQPLNTFPASYTSSVFSNPFQKYQADKSIYAVVETATVSINTDPYEPFKEEFQRMKKEYELLQMDLTSALTQKQELASHLQEMDHRFKTFELEVGIKNDAFGKERQSMQEKHDMLYLECSHINQQLNQYVEMEKELKSRILRLEEEKQELFNQKSKERQELRNVEDDIKKRHEEYKTICDKEKERAARAEVEVLNLKKQAAVTMLERSKKEAMYHVHHLKGLHKTHQEQGKEVPGQMIKALGFYENIVAKCSETIPKLVGEFDEQITQIQNGKCMADLLPVYVPPPPPVFPPNSPRPETKALGDEASKTTEIPVIQPSVTNMSGLSPISTKTTQPSVSGQPRPLAPPPGLQTQSLRQQIPRLANNNVQNTPKNSFEKLLQRLTTTFPQYNRSIFTQLIQQLRQSRGGSLSGLTIDEIIQQIVAMVQAHEQKQGKNQTPPPQVSKPAFPGPGPTKPVGPPPGLTNSWGPSDTQNKGEELFEEEQDPCVICHEEMTPDTTVKLECHHRFHDECIRKWLKENSTCPNCRIYALLPDEFPTLV